MSEEKRSLTKKNEDFVFRFKKIILQNSKLSTEKIEEIIAEIEDELRVAQKSGQTAAQLFGTPTQAAQKYLDPKQTAKRMHEFKFWTLALDTTFSYFYVICCCVWVYLVLFKKWEQSSWWWYCVINLNCTTWWHNIYWRNVKGNS